MNNKKYRLTSKIDSNETRERLSQERNRVARIVVAPPFGSSDPTAEYERKLAENWRGSWMSNPNLSPEHFQAMVQVLSVCQRRKNLGITRLVSKTDVTRKSVKDLSGMVACAFIETDLGENRQTLCGQLVAEEGDSLCPKHRSLVSGQKMQGMEAVLLPWNDRILTIFRPTPRVEPPINPQPRFGDQQQPARIQWWNQKQKIKNMLKWLRQGNRPERFKPGTIRVQDTDEFERTFASGRSDDQKPMIEKIWAINDQIKKFYGFPESDDLATEFQVDQFFQIHDQQNENQGVLVREERKWPPQFKKNGHLDRDLIQNYEKDHVTRGVLGGNELGNDYPMVGLAMLDPVGLLTQLEDKPDGTMSLIITLDGKRDNFWVSKNYKIAKIHPKYHTPYKSYGIC